MKRKKVKFIIVLVTVLTLLCGSVIGGYFAIDRVLVPKYFGRYGINDLPELVDIVQTIYVVPSEDTFITNPYTKADATSMTAKFKDAGFPILSTGEVDFEKVANQDYSRVPSENFTDNYLYLTDKEIATILNQILDTGILVSNFKSLSYLDTLQMEVKQLTITPIELESTASAKLASETLLNFSSKSANLSLTVKISTESAKKQIAKNIDAPQFLIDWIIPETMYITASFSIDRNEKDEIIYTNTNLSINSKTPKQSEVLLSLLISFIYPDSENMTIDELTTELAKLTTSGLNLLGNFEYVQIQTTASSAFGIKLELPPAEVTLPESTETTDSNQN